ncbi:MAG TPA: GNAT family N-acetyltransferase [Thermodesulfobacteriota bacterium]|nr:GNAT family N-acetyltransferase [Thermodesulfobacteriota bacterium]
MVLSPYPKQNYEAPWVLKDGTPVILRPLKPEDEDMMTEFLHNLSMETLLLRFFHALKAMSHKEIVRYTRIDYGRDAAIIAVEQKSGKDHIIGEGRITYYPNLDTCEFSVVVADPWQGKGLGKKLLKACIRIAKEKRARLLWGDIMAENGRMIRLCKSLGFSIDFHLWKGWEGIVRATMRLN